VKSDTLGTIVNPDPFVVNLEDGNNYLKIDMALELSDDDVKQEIEKRKPQIRDAVLLILSTKGLKDIKTSHGKIVLKDELLMRLNSFLSTGLIRNIYFTSFVIQ
jgi:flagellar FliL protein